MKPIQSCEVSERESYTDFWGSRYTVNSGGEKQEKAESKNMSDEPYDYRRRINMNSKKFYFRAILQEIGRQQEKTEEQEAQNSKVQNNSSENYKSGSNCTIH
ncbi:hypothetical protein C922_05262 [Plasmodium inui San Antonio 1]|uniref:Uncharacterized protein n=1 Tax=Plasmodium inui San Antonio 1 TaxID=1237626 RepID=W7A5I9_9APIC|nr:hypothetical protein C922_05262 [Plasmodium inui San Antonio 1]EUD64359.1 hypothetical protein C922_05262 [Plasmodium inui San Antonio 1]